MGGFAHFFKGLRRYPIVAEKELSGNQNNESWIMIVLKFFSGKEELLVRRFRMVSVFGWQDLGVSRSFFGKFSGCRGLEG